MLYVKLSITEMERLANAKDVHPAQAVLDVLKDKNVGLVNEARRSIAQALESTAKTVKPKP